jgi:hypothetical protein
MKEKKNYQEKKSQKLKIKKKIKKSTPLNHPAPNPKKKNPFGPLQPTPKSEKEKKKNDPELSNFQKHQTGSFFF